MPLMWNRVAPAVFFTPDAHFSSKTKNKFQTGFYLKFLLVKKFFPKKNANLT